MISEAMKAQLAQHLANRFMHSSTIDRAAVCMPLVQRFDEVCTEIYQAACSGQFGTNMDRVSRTIEAYLNQGAPQAKVEQEPEVEDPAPVRPGTVVNDLGRTERAQLDACLFAGICTDSRLNKCACGETVSRLRYDLMSAAYPTKRGFEVSHVCVSTGKCWVGGQRECECLADALRVRSEIDDGK